MPVRVVGAGWKGLPDCCATKNRKVAILIELFHQILQERRVWMGKLAYQWMEEAPVGERPAKNESIQNQVQKEGRNSKIN